MRVPCVRKCFVWIVNSMLTRHLRPIVHICTFCTRYFEKQRVQLQVVLENLVYQYILLQILLGNASCRSFSEHHCIFSSFHLATSYLHHCALFGEWYIIGRSLVLSTRRQSAYECYKLPWVNMIHSRGNNDCHDWMTKLFIPTLVYRFSSSRLWYIMTITILQAGGQRMRSVSALFIVFLLWWKNTDPTRSITMKIPQ